MDQATLFSNNEREVERSQRLHEFGFACGQANVINLDLIRNTLKKNQNNMSESEKEELVSSILDGYKAGITIG